MTNYKQILEAVNRGIQLALDDFDDDQVQNIKSKQVYNRDFTKEYLELGASIIQELIQTSYPNQKTGMADIMLGENQKQNPNLDGTIINLEKIITN